MIFLKQCYRACFCDINLLLPSFPNKPECRDRDLHKSKKIIKKNHAIWAKKPGKQCCIFYEYFPMYWQSLQEVPSSCEQSSYCAGQLGGCGLMYGIVCMLFLTERKCIKMKTVLPQQPHHVCASVQIGLCFFFFLQTDALFVRFMFVAGIT